MDLQVVTSNEGKFREVAAFLEPHGVRAALARVTYPEVQADSLEEVVTFGLGWLAARRAGNFLIDDSGLFVEALGGFPGVYSSYVHRTLGMGGVLRLLDGGKPRRAAFRTCLGLRLDGRDELIQGECSGTIAPEPRGKGGFGYDPIFIPDGQTRTFAEMALGEKNAISHRGRALQSLVEVLGARR